MLAQRKGHKDLATEVRMGRRRVSTNQSPTGRGERFATGSVNAQLVHVLSGCAKPGRQLVSSRLPPLLQELQNPAIVATELTYAVAMTPSSGASSRQGAA
jgi:hypothetical protein